MSNETQKITLHSDMEAIAAIETRQSVRSFTEEPVSSEAITTLLHAALCAPSAHNFRPFHFVTVTNRETLERLSTGNQYAHMVKDAPLAIAVCGDTVAQPTLEFILEDCSAAIQNLLLAAHALGLGAVWCGVKQGHAWQDEIAEILRLPKTALPMAVVAVGHPKRKPAPLRERFEEEKIHSEGW